MDSNNWHFTALLKIFHQVQQNFADFFSENSKISSVVHFDMKILVQITLLKLYRLKMREDYASDLMFFYQKHFKSILMTTRFQVWQHCPKLFAETWKLLLQSERPALKISNFSSFKLVLWARRMQFRQNCWYFLSQVWKKNLWNHNSFQKSYPPIVFVDT